MAKISIWLIFAGVALICLASFGLTSYQPQLSPQASGSLDFPLFVGIAGFIAVIVGIMKAK